MYIIPNIKTVRDYVSIVSFQGNYTITLLYYKMLKNTDTGLQLF